MVYQDLYYFPKLVRKYIVIQANCIHVLYHEDFSGDREPANILKSQLTNSAKNSLA